ncbi:MAG: Two-component system response regulator [uncultured Sulfurovum sp.]|uniref:Two-component system response regulator n=1 Tax=uncultured Sulfurovum sp. TaxID=269237 RepID=A0A6S6T4L0_9BACT|nr:MAG: Two-component system response regulator [uncultured Sulfurovum sp.]
MQNEHIEIVIIEDEEDILELLEYHLQKAGYATIGFTCTQNVEQFLEEEHPSLLIVDRNLPKVEGSKFIAKMREKGHDIPVIFLTAKDTERDVDDGFIRGGDDYITKPFRMNEVLHRIKAILKRVGVIEQNRLKHRDLLLDLEKQVVLIDERVIKLTKMEFRLLHIFIKNAHKPLQREFLLEEVSGDSQGKTINVAINRLKNKIDPDGSKEYIISIWGVGYKLA